MTEKKRLPEQIASHTYRPSAATGWREGISARAQEGSYPTRRREPVRYESRVLQRIVTVPDSDPSTAWNTFAERQEQRRRARARPQRYSEAAPRTLAHTGVRASSGRIRAVRRSLQHASPIPARSGRRTMRRGLLWRLLSFFAVSIVIIVAVNFALTSAAFRVAQVNIIGTHNPSLKRVIQGMGIQGQNIFLISVASLTDRIDALSLVASANLSKQFPNQLTIALVERVPVVWWQTPQGTFSVDNQGMVMASSSETSGAGHLPTVVMVASQGPVHPGVRLNPADIAFATAIFDRLTKMTGITTFRLQYDGTMYASTSDEFGGGSGKGSYIIESPDGWKAYLGGPNDANPLDNRLTELQQILAMAQKEQFSLATIDLRYGLRPVYTLKK